MEIRTARVEDATAITQCVAAAYQRYIARLGKPPGPMLDDYEGVIQRHRVFVLIEGQTTIGILVLIVQDHTLLVDNVAVHPDHQGKGFGRRLMAVAEEEARGQGFAVITLYTNELMTENIEMYKKLGYLEVECKTEHGYRRVYMQKSLSDERKPITV